MNRMAKNLVYCCVFYNKDYFKLLELLLKSMIVFSRYDTFDFLIMTQEEFLPLVLELEIELRIKLKTFCIPCSNIFQAACARLSIFDYPLIEEYSKILYLDTDILIKKDITPVLDLEIDDKLHAVESGTISSASFGVYFFDFENIHKNIDKNTTGINSGTLLFKNSDTMKTLFADILKHIKEYTEAGRPMLYCMDQPFINYGAIKDNLHNNTVLNEHVSLYEDNNEVTNYETSSICHFSYPIGNFAHKYYRMATFLKKILTERSTEPANIDILHRQYSWDAGFIIFMNDNHLVTKWSANGQYTILQPNRVEAVWNNHYHSLTFNTDKSQFLSIRTHPPDFVVTFGSLNNQSWCGSCASAK